MSKYKIKAIVESKLERWFEDADVNTCITILERCKNREERENNLVRFIQLKVPLRRLIPVTNSEKKRFGAIIKLIKVIEKTDKFYEDDKIRIFPKNQKELWKEGFDEGKNKYIGSKWGKYLKAPQIFFEILEKSEDLFVPLKEIAEVRRGFTTGVNEFFYLTEEKIKRSGIEKEFWMHKEKGKWIPNYVIKSPRECKGIIVNPGDLKYRVLMIHKSKQELKGTNILKYIQQGEEQGFHRRPTCASRNRWYDLGRRKPRTILWEMIHFERLKAPYNKYGVFVDHNLFEILPKSRNDGKLISAQLNSTFFGIIRELWGRCNLGQGSLKTEGIDIEKFPVIKTDGILKKLRIRLEKAFDEFVKRPKTDSILCELRAPNAKDVSLDKIEPDRRKLDKIVMGRIFRLSDEEQLEIYRAVVDLVKSRIEKAKSVKKRRKKGKFDISALAEDILQETKIKELKKFPDQYVTTSDFREMRVPEGGQVEVESDLFHGIHVKVGEEVIKCKNYDEASYIKYATLNGNRVVKIPNDENVLRKATKEYGKLLNEIKTKAEKTLDEFVPDKKIKEQVRKEIIRRIFTRNRGG